MLSFNTCVIRFFFNQVFFKSELTGSLYSQGKKNLCKYSADES